MLAAVPIGLVQATHFFPSFLGLSVRAAGRITFLSRAFPVGGDCLPDERRG
jgi:hypothetical protein